MFKIGDWIRTDGDGIYKIVNDFTLYDHDSEVWEMDIKRNINKVKPWKPKAGENCWFFLNDSPNPILGQFSGYDLGKIITYNNGTRHADSCEPFIGELPSCYKRK